MPDPEPVDPFADEALPETAPVRPGEHLDWPRIERYLREHLPRESVDLDGAFEVMQFPNGSANLTYLIRFGGTELVLRRPPFGTLAPGAHDMKREYRVLSRLWRLFDAAPRAYLFSDDHAVGGADFFVMERRRGEVVRGVIPASMRHHKDVGYRIGMALVERIAEFHTVDPKRRISANWAGLTASSAVSCAAGNSVGTWWRDERYDADMTTCTASLSPDYPIRSASRSSTTTSSSTTACSIRAIPTASRLFSIGDMTTLGDPLIDVGTLLNYWPDPGDREDEKRFNHNGMDRMGLAPRAQIVARYAQRSGLDLTPIGWYEAFALWKTATVIQQLHYRWKVGDFFRPAHGNGRRHLAGTRPQRRQLLA